jgi:carbonic anhydrase
MRQAQGEFGMSLTTLEQCAGLGCSCHAPVAPQVGWSRRRVLGGVTAAALAGAASGALLSPTKVRAEETLSPAAALQKLMDGNKRYVDRKLTFFDEDLAILRQNTAEKQVPFASVLSCADSRVPVELLFDQSIGHVFVNRVAGNIATSEIIASIEYGVAVLGTRVLMVLGHGGCGALEAALASKVAPGQITALYRHLRPAVNEAGGDLEKAVKANAVIQAKLLSESSVVIEAALKAETLKVVAAYYDLASGKVTLLG